MKDNNAGLSLICINKEVSQTNKFYKRIQLENNKKKKMNPWRKKINSTYEMVMNVLRTSEFKNIVLYLHQIQLEVTK